MWKAASGRRTPKPSAPPILAVLLGACWWCLGHFAVAADVDFYRDVYPVLKANCIACHNKTTTKAGLSLETPEAIREGGDSGEGALPGNGAESPVYQAAAHAGDVEMPPKGNKVGASDLTPAELAILKSWIDQGAKGSARQQARQVVWQPLPSVVNPIYAAALTRDGRFAACGRANQVFVYDLATRQLAARLVDDALAKEAHRALVQSLAFSPDGLRLASGSYREVKIWRREGPPVVTRKGDPALGAVTSVLSDDGKRLVCADKGGTLHVLDAASGKTLRRVPAEIKDAVTLLRLSPDASKAAVYGAGTLSLWDLAGGKRIGLKPDLAGVHVLAWTRDGKAIATAGDDKVVRVWPLPAGDKAELAAPKELKGATGAVTALEAGADPNLLIAASAGGKVRVWDIAGAKPVRELSIAGVVSLGLSGDGTRLAVGRADGPLQVWDLAAGKSLIDLIGDPETNSRLAALVWTVAAEGLELAFQQQEVARLEADNKALDERIKKTGDSIASVRKELEEKRKALKPMADVKDAAQQVAAEAAVKALEIHLKDAEAEVRNYSEAKSRNGQALDAAKVAQTKAKDARDKATADIAAIKKATGKPQPRAVRFSADAQTVASVLADGSVRVWAIASGLPVLSPTGGTSSLAACPDGAFITCGADGATAQFSTSPRWILERTLGGDSAASPFADRVNALRFSPDGKMLAAGGGEPTRSGDVSLWDVATGALVKEWKERHADAVVSLDFSPDGKRLASGGADKVARVTDVASGQVVNVFEGHSHHVLGVSFRADGRILATAGGDGVVVVWDMLSGERKKKVEGWSKEVTSLQFIGATNRIVTSAGDNQVRIVDDNGSVIRALAKLPEFMQAAASTPAADVVIGGGEDGVLRVWNGTNGQELAAFGPERR